MGRQYFTTPPQQIIEPIPEPCTAELYGEIWAIDSPSLEHGLYIKMSQTLQEYGLPNKFYKSPSISPSRAHSQSNDDVEGSPIDTGIQQGLATDATASTQASGMDELPGSRRVGFVVGSTALYAAFMILREEIAIPLSIDESRNAWVRRVIHRFLQGDIQTTPKAQKTTRRAMNAASSIPAEDVLEAMKWAKLLKLKRSLGVKQGKSKVEIIKLIMALKAEDDGETRLSPGPKTEFKVKQLSTIISPNAIQISPVREVPGCSDTADTVLRQTLTDNSNIPPRQARIVKKGGYEYLLYT
ncbi:hypothetical protein CVT24_012118 [Panaeolus cyanescens]|uniref:Uncharacterized protein n=1 Tax=Panaeolus cyanescens TaxID=181874 RepID=A0A409VHJ1_9AGAR|nr:hypothetical protein CVT24_012118 [Panaeolus cyanescens]